MRRGSRLGCQSQRLSENLATKTAISEEVKMLDDSDKQQQLQKVQKQMIEQQQVLDYRRREQEQFRAQLHQEQMQLMEW